MVEYLLVVQCSSQCKSYVKIYASIFKTPLKKPISGQACNSAPLLKIPVHVLVGFKGKQTVTRKAVNRNKRDTWSYDRN